MKISIIGASGKVAKQIIQSAFLFNKSPDLEFCLLSNNTNLVSSQILDVQSTASLLDNPEYISPKHQVSDQFEDTTDSDYVIICAGRFMPDAEKEKYRKIDPSGRLAHTFASLNMMVTISEQIQKHTPKSKVIVVTNQSDIMSEIARTVIDRNNVFGVGGMLDEARFSHVLATTTNSFLPNNQKVKPSAVHADIIGCHNNDMVLLQQSLKAPEYVIDMVNHAPSIIEGAMTATKGYGRNISKNRDTRHPTVHGGASIS